MARPQKNNVEYFPFICEDGKKMYYIEETYGNDGFATFVKLLRELAKADHHYLDLSSQSTIMFLSAKCKVSKEILLAIVNDLVELGKFDKLLWSENSIIWCHDFVDSIQDAYKKRNNKCITYEGLLTLLVSLGVRKPSKSIPKVSDNPQSKVNNSKEEESIENEPPILENRFHVIEEMYKEFTKVNLNYAKDTRIDFPAIKLFAEFIANRQNDSTEIVYIDLTQKHNIVNEFGKIANWYKNTNCTKSLETLAKFEIQKIFNELAQSGQSGGGIKLTTNISLT